MKAITLSLVLFLFLVSCDKDDDTDTPDTVDQNYKTEMRNFVIGISKYAKAKHTGFSIIPQNGIELVTETGDDNAAPQAAYLAAIDGNGQEDLFYGYNNDDDATPSNDNAYLVKFLKISKNAGNTIFVTDYCSTHSKMDDANQKNQQEGFLSFAASHRELDIIPNYPSPIFNENTNNITKLSDAQNFLYLINPDNFSSKADFIQSVTNTNYDVILMDLFFKDGTEFTASEINQLRSKKNGGSRMVICYMSIGEAENYRYYWKAEWNSTKPAWLDAENPDWPGNFKVKYWDKDWQAIIYGNDNSYLKKIIDADFDGVYLDIIDAFEYFE
jgi:cysteinyl-tRNA synthetase